MSTRGEKKKETRKEAGGVKRERRLRCGAGRGRLFPGLAEEKEKAGGKETCALDSRDVLGEGSNTPGRLGQKQSRGPRGQWRLGVGTARSALLSREADFQLCVCVGTAGLALGSPTFDTRGRAEFPGVAAASLPRSCGQDRLGPLKVRGG